MRGDHPAPGAEGVALTAPETRPSSSAVAAAVGEPGANIKATPPSSTEAPVPGLRPDHLGPAAIAFFVVAAVGPMAAVVGGSPVVFASEGGSTPATYVLAGLLFALFSVGYVAMSRHMFNAAGFVAYIARGLGVRAGTSAAGVTVVSYIAIMCSLWAFFGVFAHGVLLSKLHLDINGNLFMFVILALATAMAWRGVDVSLRVLGTLLLCEVISLLILDVKVIFSGGGVSGNSFAGFKPSGVFGSGLGVGFLFAVACFTGFESTVVFSEEARQPRRTIPRATYIAVGFIAVFYCVCTWVLSNVYGIGAVGHAAASNPAGFVFAAAKIEVGSGLETVMEILVMTSFFAMLVGFQNMFCRYVFGLGRAGVLPRKLGVANATTGSPARAALAIGVVLAIILAGFTAAGANPVTVTYSWLLALGTVGYIAVLALTSVAILVFFARERVETNPWVTRIAPALAGAGLVLAGYLAIANYTTLLGGQGGAARYLLIALPAAAVGGFAFAHVRHPRRPIDYATELV